MKKLLFVFLLVSGAAAMANNTDPALPAKIQEKRVAVAASAYEKYGKGKKPEIKIDEPKKNVCRTSMQSNMSRLDLSLYFVEMVNSNNLKLIKKILD